MGKNTFTTVGNQVRLATDQVALQEIVGVIPAAKGGFGIDISAQNGYAKFATGTPTFASTIDGADIATGSIDGGTAINDGTISPSKLQLDATYDFSGADTTILAKNPTADTQVANKVYVDSVAAGITYTPARVKTQVALPACTYANGAAGAGATLTADANGFLPTINGVSDLAEGQEIFVAAEANLTTLGKYVITSIGGASKPWVLTRSADYNLATKIVSGKQFFVSEGTVDADSYWTLSNDGTIVIGTTDLTFVRAGAAQDISASGFIAKTGNVLSFKNSSDFDADGSGNMKIANHAVTLEKMDSIASGKFLGRTSSGTGDVELLDISSLASARTTQTKTADFTAVDGFNYLVDTSGGAVNVTLPAASSINSFIMIKKMDVTGYQINLVPATGEAVEFEATNATLGLNSAAAGYAIASQGDSVSLFRGATGQIVLG